MERLLMAVIAALILSAGWLCAQDSSDSDDSTGASDTASTGATDTSPGDVSATDVSDISPGDVSVTNTVGTT